MRKNTAAILKLLDENYGAFARCYLDYKEPWQLLISTILSAQCTDARVNQVTPELFKKYPDIKSLAMADISELEEDIRSTGFFHNKAKNIIGCCKKLHYEFKDELPSTIEELTSLPGVGRKTANVVRSHIFNIDSVVVDTHVKRISNKLGLAKGDDPVKLEFALMKEIPKDHWSRINTQLIKLGREICKAPTPKCSQCFLTEVCPTYKKDKKQTVQTS